MRFLLMVSVGPRPASHRRVLTVLAAAAIVVFSMSVLWWTQRALELGVFGFDYLAYDAAARRVLTGDTVYDMRFTTAGAFGLYFYPPPFVLVVLPLTLVDAHLATWLWAALGLSCLLAGIALMPIPCWVRWSVLLLNGLSFPVAKTLVLGQVGPLLLFCFAAAWRWLQRDVVAGVVGAAGALIKLQPSSVLAWAALVRRPVMLGAGIAAIVAASVVATVVAGLGTWLDWLTLLIRVGDPVSQEENVNLGALLYRAGVGHDTAVAVHWLHVGVAMRVWRHHGLRWPPVVSFMATIVVSQLVSPILWDHYAVVLLVPVAWLLGRGVWWAAAVPLLSPSFLGASVPPLVYLAGYWGTLAMLGLPRLRTETETGSGLGRPDRDAVAPTATPLARTACGRCSGTD